ncbi:MAG TPA: hypothetical protein VK548_10795 [Candidatus Acidoferrum sp.]|nr:hypothetical protein [Candidatus Acidoferrum sp.]
MTMVRARAATLAFVTCVAATSWLLPVTASAAIPLQSFVTVTAGNGFVPSIHTAPLGPFTVMEVAVEFASFGFLDVPNADSVFAVDVYVGMILPDGRFVSWVGDPFGSSFVTGPAPAPLFVGVVPSVGNHHAYRWLTLTTPGWCVLYGLVVRAGANPLDPREWAGWNPAAFYPLLVVPK